MFEKLVLSRLKQHLELNNIIPKEQHGFCTGKSTITALTEIIEYMIDSLEAGETVSSIFLDLSKAFDCLNIDTMLANLETRGVKGIVLNWVESYLKGRKQVVELTEIVNNVERSIRSSYKNVIRGVPQGSVLSPLLYVLYTSDFQKSLEEYSSSVMFADDKVILSSSNSTEQLEIKSFISISLAQDFLRENDLVLNEPKTKQLFPSKVYTGYN